MKIGKFLKYYFSEIIRTWWVIIIFIPTFIPKFLILFSFYFGIEYSVGVEKILNWLSPLGKWVIPVTFLFVHIRVIYKLWKENTSKPIPIESSSDVSEKYDRIIRKVEKFIPEKSKEFKENLSKGYKCLVSSDDIKTAISEHFDAYKIIKDFFDEHFRSTSVDVRISKEVLELKNFFENNFSELKDYNDRIGRNENVQIYTHTIRKLTDNINDNLSSIFSSF